MPNLFDSWQIFCSLHGIHSGVRSTGVYLNAVSTLPGGKPSKHLPKKRYAGPEFLALRRFKLLALALLQFLHATQLVFHNTIGKANILDAPHAVCAFQHSVMTVCLSETARYLLAQQKEINVLKDRLVSLASTTDLYDLFQSVPGIGPYLSAALIAELKDIRRFENHKKLIAYCGFDPTIIQSGKSIHYNGPISKRGNSTARKVIFYTTSIMLVVARKTNHQMPLLLYYEKKRGEGKHHHACVVACCTKLLRILLAMSKQNTPYK